MSELRRHCYEGMFLFGQSAAGDLAGAIEHVREIMSRAGAEIVAMRKWDERRLAYEIEKNKRGIYILVYFNCDAQRLVSVERDCNLSDHVLRVMLLRVDHMSDDEVRAMDATQALEDEARLRRERGDAAIPVLDDEPAVGVGADDLDDE